jgi:hypothetical protein
MTFEFLLFDIGMTPWTSRISHTQVIDFRIYSKVNGPQVIYI